MREKDSLHRPSEFADPLEPIPAAPADPARRGTRTIIREVEIRAPIDPLWRALTDPIELSRWFPVDAQVAPGAGGSMRFSWGDRDDDFEATIVAWEPGARLLMTYEIPDESGESHKLYTEYGLHAEGAESRLRIMHSGFRKGEAWDELFEATRLGWDLELRGLQLYLERHRGTARRLLRVDRALSVSVHEAWMRIMGKRGILAHGTMTNTHEGSPFSLRTASGLRLNGHVRMFRQPHVFAAILENFNRAFLRVNCERTSQEPRGSQIKVGISTYGLSEPDLTNLAKQLDELLAGCFQSVHGLSETIVYRSRED